jgi:hypothetical protein
LDFLWFIDCGKGTRTGGQQAKRTSDNNELGDIIHGVNFSEVLLASTQLSFAGWVCGAKRLD